MLPDTSLPAKFEPFELSIAVKGVGVTITPKRYGKNTFIEQLHKVLNWTGHTNKRSSRAGIDTGKNRLGYTDRGSWSGDSDSELVQFL